MGTKQSRLRRKPPSELPGWRKRRIDDKPSSEKEKEEVEGATHAVGRAAATPSPGITILHVATRLSVLVPAASYTGSSLGRVLL